MSDPESESDFSAAEESDRDNEEDSTVDDKEDSSSINKVILLDSDWRDKLTIYDVYRQLRINNGWGEILDKLAPSVKSISKAIWKHCENKHFPAPIDVFNVFLYTPFDKIKVVIIGQDPYPTPGNAMGLAFSVRKDRPIPDSLVNIYSEIETELGCMRPSHGSLIKWAVQGVFLFNISLTIGIEKGKGQKHDIFWPQFTHNIIQIIAEKRKPIFLLWGRDAQKIKKMISSSYILEAAHPSPMSADRGFFGCGHFKSVNTILSKQGKETIDWEID